MINKKIDFFNKDNNKRTNNNLNKEAMGRKPRESSGSKTSKPIYKNTIVPKRRGRRPKKILENVTAIDSPIESPNKNNPAVILRLNIDPAKLKNIKKTNTTEKPATSTKSPIKNGKKNVQSIPEEDSADESSEGMFKNDIPGDIACHGCSKKTKENALLKSKLDKFEKKEKIDKSNKIYNNKLNFISYTSGKKVIIKKTNIKCWWDAHTFTTLPCFLPELFHNNTYHVRGCFCSYNCALAYNLYYLKDSKVHQRKSLIYKLYREMYGLSSDEIIDIKEAPPKEILEDFGGDMSIDVFRRRFFMGNKEYIVFVPPIKPLNVIIEERNVDLADDNDKKYVLKRSKPLAKKRSVISSMKIKMTDEEDD